MNALKYKGYIWPRMNHKSFAAYITAISSMAGVVQAEKREPQTLNYHLSEEEKNP